jgi:AcrR family transcriptional regulator
MCTLRAMARPVKTRKYMSPLREERAQQTRHAILEAARRAFAAGGYATTTIAQIAAEADVAIDTVYASVGTKPSLFRLLVETAISGTDVAVTAEERDYVQRIRAASSARAKIDIYAQAASMVLERMAPLQIVLGEAAAHTTELAQMRDEIDERRARNMRLFASELAATGQLRPDIDIAEVGDVVWATSSAQMYALLVARRGWSRDRYAQWLRDTWRRLFLARPGPSARL